MNKIICLIVVMFSLIGIASAAHQLPSDLYNDSTGILTGTATWANNVTYGWFWAAMLFTFCVVLFFAASRYTSERAFGYASVSGMLGAIFMITLNLMTWKVGAIFIFAGILGLVWMILRKEYG